MILRFLRVGVVRSVATALLGLLPLAVQAQVPLSAGTQVETFDGLAGGMPAGWSVRTGAGAVALGTEATLNSAATSWSTTSGQWRNSAAADNAGFVATTSSGDQAAAADRALGLRQTGSFGDPGASANFYFSTTGLQVTAVSFSAQMLSVQTRSTEWALQYGLGAEPTSWTTVATFADPGAFGATPISAAGLGTALDDQSAVWLRVVALSGTTGSGSRDTFGIDDFTVVTTSLGGGPVAPSVTADPTSLTVPVGGSAVFSVAASGTGPFTYQWRKGGVALTDSATVTGTTTDTLTLSDVQASDAGGYDVEVTNGVGSATSAVAVLDVDMPTAPVITTGPVAQTIPVGGSAVFSVQASGTAPLAYQWYFNGSEVTGETAATLTLSGVTLADAGSYSVMVTNGAGSATSAAAVLTIEEIDRYWNLATADFAQDWSNTNLITVNDDWSAVPSIVGYRGDALTSSTGADPQTLTGASDVVDVIANASPTSTSGGVAELDGVANPVVALQGSGTADAPNLVLFLDTRGRAQVTVSYLLRDMDAGNDDAEQAVALQYRVGETGDFVNVPAGFVADATSGPGLADLETPVSVTLPAAAENQAKLQVRVITANAAGSDEWVGVDNITVTSVSDGVARVLLRETGDVTLVAEAGLTTDTYTVRLNTPPVAPVTVRVTSDGQTLVSADGVTFGLGADLVLADTTPVTVHVRAADDTVNEPATHFSVITHAVLASVDPAYPVSLPIASLTAAVLDDDGGTGLTLIHTVQGSGAISPLVGYEATVNAVVTGFFSGSTGRVGFYVQEQDADADLDPATSEGVYVFVGSSSPLASVVDSLTLGDVVTVSGSVAEYNQLTEIESVVAITVTGTDVLPSAVAVVLPLVSADALEPYEGMRVTLPQTLTVTDNYDLGAFGEIALSLGRLPQPTNVAAPGAPAQALAAANALNRISLDDAASPSFPDPTPFQFDDGTGATLRAGDTATGLAGVLTYQFGAYTVQAQTPPVFTRSNPRPLAAPTAVGSLRITSGNVLNLFNGDGAGGGFPTARGASTHEEYERQLAKEALAILELNPDIMGLLEVENDGYGADSALADLVTTLNAAASPGTSYAYVDASAVDIVTDLIHSAFIYRVETVDPVGGPAMLSNPYFNNHARNPLAQTFREKATGAVLTVSINHFRAKGSVSSVSDGIVPNPNNDSGDGQGNNNYLRTKEAEALIAWLATDPTGSGDADFLIIGDLNAYAKEDPIATIEAAGYVNLAAAFEGAGGYSYAFDGAFGHLDHALASPSLAAQVTATETWHVNADEPAFLDYNLENKSLAQQAINAGTPYRYSDHDPVVIDLNPVAPPTVLAQLNPTPATVGDSVTFAVNVIGAPAPTFQWRRDGVAIVGAVEATLTIAPVSTADAGIYDVVVSNAYGTVISAPTTLTVAPAAASVTLGDLFFAYDGTPHAASVTTAPSGLNVVLTYDGALTPPTLPGTYAVVATIDEPDYFGTASDTLVVKITALVRHVSSLNAGLDGSLQVISPDSVTLNGGAWISGDLLVPGTPTVRLNGHPTYGGTLDAAGAAAPTSHRITLNGNSVLGHVVRRVDGVALPTVPAPPAPTGTRYVYLNRASDPTGDFATLRDLTLNGNVGAIAVPPGTYGRLTANNGSLVLGVAGAVEPAVYNLQGLTLNGNSHLDIVGPVVLNLAQGTALNGSVFTGNHPEWLALNIAAGGLTLNGQVTVEAFVTAPNGTVTINGGSLTGGVVADRLVLNGNAVLIDPLLP